MSLRKMLFGKKTPKIETYADFWQWFEEHQEGFLRAVRGGEAIEDTFFDPIQEQLHALDDGIYVLAGVENERAEVIFTADGRIKTLPSVEALVAAAPDLPDWTFVAHKAPLQNDNLALEMAGYSFSVDTLRFYLEQDAAYPDAVDVVLVHDEWTQENAATMARGATLFLDNFLGELARVEHIDHISVLGPTETHATAHPLSELRSALDAHQARFKERYDDVRWNDENDQYAALQGALPNGRPVVAVMNTDLLRWENRPSHPWMLVVQIHYKGDKKTGMPNDKTYALLDEIEARIAQELRSEEGYLHVGRETSDNVRELYLACRTYRKPANVLMQVRKTSPPQLAVEYEIYRDTHWRGLSRFQQVLED